jgi:hypothetical protein
MYRSLAVTALNLRVHAMTQASVGLPKEWRGIKGDDNAVTPKGKATKVPRSAAEILVICMIAEGIDASRRL